MGCCASTFRKVPTCPRTHRSDSSRVATELNDRPRKTLGGITPTQAMQRLLWTPNHPSLRRPPEFADVSLVIGPFFGVAA